MSAAAIMVGGQIVQGVGAYQSAEDKAAAYRAEAAAKRAQAAQVTIGANYEIAQIQRRYELVKGAQLSAFGRSGVQATTGSPLLQMEETAANAFDEMRATANAANYRRTSLLTEGQLSDFNAGSAERAGFYGLFGAGLGALSKNPYSYDYPRTSGGVV
jgi:hypothetical protein